MRARLLLRARAGSVLGPSITPPRAICLHAPPVRTCAGNPVLDDVGTWLKDEITAHFKKIGKPLNLKYIGAACSTRCCAQRARVGWLLLWKRSRACLHPASPPSKTAHASLPAYTATAPPPHHAPADPSYIIRSSPANASDSNLCTTLAFNCVHGAMGGYTGACVAPRRLAQCVCKTR